VRALAVGVDELADGMPPLEPPRIDLHAERRDRVEVGLALLNLFLL
jgi:hypothetical protein